MALLKIENIAKMGRKIKQSKHKHRNIKNIKIHTTIKWLKCRVVHVKLKLNRTITERARHKDKFSWMKRRGPRRRGEWIGVEETRGKELCECCPPVLT